MTLTPTKSCHVKNFPYFSSIDRNVFPIIEIFMKFSVLCCGAQNSQHQYWNITGIELESWKLQFNFGVFPCPRCASATHILAHQERNFARILSPLRNPLLKRQKRQHFCCCLQGKLHLFQLVAQCKDAEWESLNCSDTRNASSVRTHSCPYKWSVETNMAPAVTICEGSS